LQNLFFGMNTKKLDTLLNKITNYKCPDCNKKLTAIEFLRLRCNACNLNRKTEFWSMLKSFQKSKQFNNRKDVIEMLLLTEQDRANTKDIKHYKKYFSLFPLHFLQGLYNVRIDFLYKIEIPIHMNLK